MPNLKHSKFVSGIIRAFGAVLALSLMGPSGSGKTTLNKILGGRLQENVRGTVLTGVLVAAELSSIVEERFWSCQDPQTNEFSGDDSGRFLATNFLKGSTTFQVLSKNIGRRGGSGATVFVRETTTDREREEKRLRERAKREADMTKARQSDRKQLSELIEDVNLPQNSNWKDN
ncbi:hypothetical protein RND71_026364 [Anisodus tanguticus]|uniref:ABC transporter domain-containing protein n=1 Tax=Anisodus tanguticus TaxID=243964 RepID=A0AAE1RKT4_9SOLA|nr:hypothetical protein RND71_026364 [Anisodus tanguticus]